MPAHLVQMFQLAQEDEHGMAERFRVSVQAVKLRLRNLRLA